MDKFVLLAPLWACADLAEAAADAAKLRNHPAYARLGLAQSACGRWLVCRVLPVPEGGGVAPCAARDCGLPETPVDAFNGNGKAFPADGLPESVFGDGWRPERGLA